MRIKLNEPKKLEFNMDTVGCSWEDLKGHLRFTFENVEYGFPAEFNNGKLTVDVPPFQSVISENLNESISKHKEIVVKGRLDVIANENNYVTPWEGDVEIEVPVAIRVKSDKNIQDILEAAKDIKVTDTKVTTISTSDANPQPFDVTLKKAKQDADRKIKQEDKKYKAKKMTKLATAMLKEPK